MTQEKGRIINYNWELLACHCVTNYDMVWFIIKLFSSLFFSSLQFKHSALYTHLRVCAYVWVSLCGWARICLSSMCFCVSVYVCMCVCVCMYVCVCVYILWYYSTALYPASLSLCGDGAWKWLLISISCPHIAALLSPPICYPPTVTQLRRFSRLWNWIEVYVQNIIFLSTLHLTLRNSSWSGPPIRRYGIEGTVKQSKILFCLHLYDFTACLCLCLCQCLCICRSLCICICLRVSEGLTSLHFTSLHFT